MKDSEFDFIKSRFDSAMPDVPSSLDESVIEQKLRSKSDFKRVRFEKKKNYKPIMSIAACFILILSLSVAFHPNGDKVNTFRSNRELNGIVSSLDRASMHGGRGGANETEPEEGVIEPSHEVSCNGYIYKVNYQPDTDLIDIYRDDNESEPVLTLKDIIADDADSFLGIQNIYADRARLVVNLSGYGCNLITKIYDLSDPVSPVLRATFEQSGQSIESRLIDGVLYLFSDYVPLDGDKAVPESSDNGSVQSLRAKDISYFESPKMLEYIVIGMIDIENCERTSRTKAVLGASEDLLYSSRCYYIPKDGDKQLVFKASMENGKVTLSHTDESDEKALSHYHTDN